MTAVQKFATEGIAPPERLAFWNALVDRVHGVSLVSVPLLLDDEAVGGFGEIWQHLSMLPRLEVNWIGTRLQQPAGPTPQRVGRWGASRGLVTVRQLSRFASAHRPL